MRRAVVAAVVALLFAGALVGVFFDRLVLHAMAPGRPFDPARVPFPPDYATEAAWSALPERPDAADAALPSLPAIDPAKAPVDVFYVHPTTYVGSEWIARADDPALADATDRVATRIQASAFNGCCAVYAPRYRQANGLAFTRVTEECRRAQDVAWRDVADAFEHFLEKRSRGRPFIVAAHSQGSVLARRLLREDVSGKPARARLVAAYLPGAPISAEDLARELPDIPLCATPEQTGCVAVWNARSAGYRPGSFEMPGAYAKGNVCVNPLSWRADGAAVPASANEGAVFLDSDAPALLPGFAGAQCAEGTLVVTDMGRPPRDFLSRLLDLALGAGNHHPIEYQLFFASLRRNAGVRTAAFLAAQGGG